MDMYEKRKQRKNKKEEMNNVEQNQTKTNINWDIGTNVKPFSSPYKIWAFAK